MNTRMCGLSAVLVALLAVSTPHAAEGDLPRQEIAKLAKPATVLVETGAAFGSGFCIHPSGLFMTNDHVIGDVPDGGTVTLVLDAGMKSQKKLKVHVIRRDKELDLALLRAP